MYSRYHDCKIAPLCTLFYVHCSCDFTSSIPTLQSLGNGGVLPPFGLFVGALYSGYHDCKIAPNFARKKIVKESIRGDTVLGEDDYISKYILGINTLEGQKKLDYEFSNYTIDSMAERAMNKDVSQWDDDDYQFVRLTRDYDKNNAKRKKVLEYLNYGKRVK